jgi:hypothetical protein
MVLHPGEKGMAETHLVGISAGLWNAVAMPVSKNSNDLYQSSIEAGRIWARLCSVIFSRSRTREDCPGVWGRAVLGISPAELEDILGKFQHEMVRD